MLRIRLFFISIFLVLLFNLDQDVEGAKCKKSFGWVKCNPCGRGTRCLFCTWCTGYCIGKNHRTKRSTNEDADLIEVPYKNPFLEMFQDLDVLLRGLDALQRSDTITDLDVVHLYKETSNQTREDFFSNNSTEIDQLSKFSDAVYKELEGLIGNPTFRGRAIEKTVQTIDLVQQLPSSLKTEVESSSDILATKMIITTGSGEYDACHSCCCKLTIEIVSPQGSCKTNVLENLGQVILGIKGRPF